MMKYHFPKFSKVLKLIKIFMYNYNLLVKPLPLPPWFIQGTDAKLKRFSMLQNFPSYITNLADGNPYSLPDEIENTLCLNSSIYIISIIQASSLPSVSLLNKLQTRGVDSINVICLRKKRKFQVTLF